VFDLNARFEDTLTKINEVDPSKNEQFSEILGGLMSTYSQLVFINLENLENLDDIKDNNNVEFDTNLNCKDSEPEMYQTSNLNDSNDSYNKEKCDHPIMCSD